METYYTCSCRGLGSTPQIQNHEAWILRNLLAIAILGSVPSSSPAWLFRLASTCIDLDLDVLPSSCSFAACSLAGHILSTFICNDVSRTLAGVYSCDRFATCSVTQAVSQLDSWIPVVSIPCLLHNWFPQLHALEDFDVAPRVP